MHQFSEHIEDNFVYCAWFAGGLRIVDIGNPAQPREAGVYVPEPLGNEAGPQSNDVDQNGLVYLLNRNRGLDIVEFAPHSQFS